MSGMDWCVIALVVATAVYYSLKRYMEHREIMAGKRRADFFWDEGERDGNDDKERSE